MTPYTAQNYVIELIPCFAVPIERLTAAQLVIIYSSTLWNPQGSLPCSQQPPLVPTLSQKNPVHSPTLFL